MGGVESKPGADDDEFGVHEVAPDTLFFMPTKESGKKPYIISKRGSPFVQFCLLSEALIDTRDRIVRTYAPTRRAPPPPPQNYHSDSSDSDDGAGMDYGGLGGEGLRQEDPELGNMPPPPVGVPVGGDAVEASPAELRDGLRNRTTSPVRAETWAIDLAVPESPHLPTAAAAPSPPRVDATRPARPFGDANYSKVARMLPVVGNAEGRSERDQYCRIDHVELWSAYRVFMVFKEEDAGLMRAVGSGAVNFTVSAHEPDVEGVTRRRVNDWRAGYAEVLNTYNTTADTFIAKAGVYLAMEGAKGNAHAAALAKMAEAVGDARAELLPIDDDALAAEGDMGAISDGS